MFIFIISLNSEVTFLMLIILPGVLAIIFLLLVILAVIVGRYLHRHKGEYLTQEDAGADTALDPDTAVVHGTTGHHVQKKKEWFI